MKLFNFGDKEKSIVCYYQDGKFLLLGSLLIQFKFKVNFYPICGF